MALGVSERTCSDSGRNLQCAIEISWSERPEIHATSKLHQDLRHIVVGLEGENRAHEAEHCQSIELDGGAQSKRLRE